MAFWRIKKKRMPNGTVKETLEQFDPSKPRPVHGYEVYHVFEDEVDDPDLVGWYVYPLGTDTCFGPFLTTEDAVEWAQDMADEPYSNWEHGKGDMQQWVENFTNALLCNAIVPEDF